MAASVSKLRIGGNAGSVHRFPQALSRGPFPVRVAQVNHAESSTPAAGSKSAYVVMNVFKVKEAHFGDFEETWRTRESHLKEMSGFIRFAMLKCVNVPGKYISMTTWADEPSFRAWTTSSQFKASHGGGKSEGQPEQASKRPGMMGMLDGPPSPEMFETVTITE